MRSPSGFGLIQQAVRIGLTVVIGCALVHSAHTRELPQPALFDSFLEVDATFLDPPQLTAARGAFGALAHRAAPCASVAIPRQDRARCVVDSLFASDQLVTIAEPGDPGSSTVTSALVSHRGNCAALTALVLSVAQRVNVPMDAVVFPRHVVVRARGNKDQVFELLDRGMTLSMSQLRKRLGAEGAHDTVVRPNAFPAYYIDNLGVRFAEAGDGDRAEAMFERAIGFAPRLARTRFNYGTYLLESNRLESAEDELRRAVRLESHNAPAWANLGVALARLGETDEARRCFDRALRYDPGNRIAAENLKTLNRGGSPPPR
jgi:tetratricopeptide (TPR) repeat protein